MKDYQKLEAEVETAAAKAEARCLSIEAQPRIEVNRIRCKKCNDTITSYSRHDFKWCKCGACFVDGGKDYLRRGGELEDIEELSEEEA